MKRLFPLLVAMMLFGGVASISAQTASFPAPRQVDSRRADLAGIRKLTGRHLTLYTDLPTSPAVDELPAVFDAAVPQWADYFGVDAAKLSGWHMQGYLIHDRAKFADLGLLPEENAQFANGYAQGHELWLEEQPSDYYRRHLLLHEGTHGFMITQLGGCGPGWYMEGMAELLATHRWITPSRIATRRTAPKKLILHQVPATRDEVPMWGRIKLVRDAYRTRNLPTVDAVLQIDNRRKLATAEYAWCWAMASMLDANARFQKPFRQLQQHVTDPEFNTRFRREFAHLWPELTVQWQSLASTLDYGHDFSRMSIRHLPARSVGAQSLAVTITADRGWQSTGWILRAGQAYRISAHGRFQIAQDGEPWISEPGGVTIEYHAGKPLGILLGALVPIAEASVADVSVTDRAESKLRPAAKLQASMFNPLAVGLGTTITPIRDGVLYLRVNDSPARLADNRGTVEVTISN